MATRPACNLIQRIDLVTLNSWNELLVTQYQGEEACMQALRDYLNGGREHQRLPELAVRCFCRNRASAIAERVEQLFGSAAQPAGHPAGALHPAAAKCFQGAGVAG
ncbi:class I adenylate cyclase [Halopseudomonas pachastrellae]|nr:class I adenylate cyclase [Halopseudomonas pachastrellae]